MFDTVNKVNPPPIICDHLRPSQLSQVDAAAGDMLGRSPDGEGCGQAVVAVCKPVNEL